MPDKEYGIRGKYKPTGKEMDDLKLVYQRFEEMKEARQPFETKWDANDKQYEALRPTTQDEWQSSIYIPMTTAIVEGILAEIVDQSPQPLILPRTSEDVAPATVMKYAFAYTWDIGNGDIELYKTLKDGLVRGTGIAQEYFLSTPHKIQELVKFDPEKGIEEYEEREILDFDDPFMEALKLEDFYPDDKGRYLLDGPHSCRDCIRRYIMDIEDVRSFFDRPVWNDLNNLKYVQPGGDTDHFEFYKPPESINKEKEIEVLWYWNKQTDKLIVVANDVVLRSSPNPYIHKRLPFARLTDILRPHEFWGKGEADLLESLNEEINKIRRGRLDRLHLNIDPMWLTSEMEVFDEVELIARPHGMIRTSDPAATKEIRPSDTPPSAYREEEQLKEDAVRVTGFDDRLQSVSTTGTATEAAILKESAMKRIRLKLRLMEKGFLTQIGRLRVANIQQFYSTPKVEQIVGQKDSMEYRKAVENARSAGTLRNIDGEDYTESYRKVRLKDKKLEERGKNIFEVATRGWTFFELKPEHIRGHFDINVEAGSQLPISKPLLQQRTEQLAQHPIIMANVEQGNYDIGKIGDKLLRAHDFNPDDFRVEVAQEEVGTEEQRMAKVTKEIEMANVENEEMRKGKPIGPTPYATPKHTSIHLSYMKSEEFKRIPQNSPVVKIFTNHASGEMEAQKRRGGGETGGGVAGAASSGMNKMQGALTPNKGSSKNAMPAKMLGGGETPPVAG